MCRFLVSVQAVLGAEACTNAPQVYKGSDEILLSKLILDPTHSVLTQSFDSRLRLDLRRPHNGSFWPRLIITPADQPRRWLWHRLLHRSQAWP
jgi:hypothetical protein